MQPINRSTRPNGGPSRSQAPRNRYAIGQIERRTRAEGRSVAIPRLVRSQTAACRNHSLDRQRRIARLRVAHSIRDGEPRCDADRRAACAAQAVAERREEEDGAGDATRPQSTLMLWARVALADTA